MLDRRLRLRLEALPFGLALFVVMASTAHATNFTVTATGDGYYYAPVFTPKTLQIHVGDTVTFTNPGAGAGGGMHNVHADDNSFQCSESCSSPNNVPSGNAWSFQRTFSQAGTVAYHCDMHGGVGGAGMSGTITVVAGGAPGALAFSSGAFGVDEGAGSVTISVTRGGGSSGAVSVSYATSDGSGVAGTDYTAASGTLSWADGDAAKKSFSVTILNDSQNTPDRTVNLALSSPTGGATLGTPSTAVLTIHEGAGTLGFSQSTYSQSEAGGSALITVDRTGSGSGAVSVQYATVAGGTAVAGKSYSSASGTLSWASGDAAAKTFTVPVIDDHAVDPALTVNLALSNPTGGAALGQTTATLKILDADGGGGPPAAPSQLTAVPVDTGSIQLTWNDNSTNEVDFLIQDRQLDGTFANVGTAPANSGPTASFTVTGLAPATVYAFQVRAENASGNSAFSNQAVASTDATPAPCPTDPQTLCLGSGGRFQVRVAFVSKSQSGNATAVPLATNPSSGLFYFFDASNIEMLIKVLNACAPPFNRYWVFLAATTNVQFTVTVTDTTTGQVQTYYNALDKTALPVEDTSAFATCP
jgi:plastocyanin